ncbi:MAG: molybdopterin-dependent oxidoreductase [Verrucomicrobiota bacterium]
MSCACKNPFNHDVPVENTPMVNVQIDGEWVQVPKGMNVVAAAERFQKHIPHYCYHPKLSVVGNCRMCLIEMGTPKMDANRQPILAADGKPEIAWMPRPQIGCATQVSEGMGIRTESPLVQECRKGVMEFLLINHPLDCPICDQAGECKLQEYSFEHGQANSRFTEEKVKKPKNVDIGERIVLDDERCVMCSRCIRFSKEFVKDDVLGFTERGSHTTLTVYPGKRFDNNYSLNTVDICPVGALTSKDFRFKMRVWFLKETKSICTGCATGCNVLIGSREKEVHRLTPRENEEVNSLWMCDSGRLGFHHIHDENRLTTPLVNGEKSDWSTAMSKLAHQLKNFQSNQIAIIASARMTNEELYLLSELRKSLGGDSILSDIVGRTGDADNILRNADKNPNTKGAQLFGFANNGKLKEIQAGLTNGSIQALLIFNESAAEAGLSLEALKNVPLVVNVGMRLNGAAHFNFPSASFAEKRGTLINFQNRLQRLNRAIPTPGQSRDDWEIIRDIKAAIGGGNGIHSVEELFKAMASSVPAFKDLTLGKVGDLGVVLNLG